MAVNSKRGRGRSLVTVIVVACVLLAASFGALAVQAWSSASSASSTITTQQQGVAYLKPLNLLIGQLVRAQSAAVRGGQSDTPDLRNAVNAVDTVDRAQDDALSARDRWGALRDRIAALLTQAPRGVAAYRAYSETVSLALDLAHKVGDTSKLNLGAQLDIFYVTDAALVRLPEVVVFTGRASDLATLGGEASSADESKVQVAVARNRVASAAEAVAANLRRADEASTNATLGVNLTGQLDVFRSAVSAFAPPTIVASFAEAVSPVTLAGAAQAVLDTSAQLSTGLLTQVDTLLSAEHDRFATSHVFTVLALVAAVLAAIALLTLVAGTRSPVTAQQVAEAELDEDPEKIDEVPEELVDIREMAADELVHLGRAVRPQVRERADDAV